MVEFINQIKKEVIWVADEKVKSWLEKAGNEELLEAVKTLQLMMDEYRDMVLDTVKEEVAAFCNKRNRSIEDLQEVTTLLKSRIDDQDKSYQSLNARITRIESLFFDLYNTSASSEDKIKLMRYGVDNGIGI